MKPISFSHISLKKPPKRKLDAQPALLGLWGKDLGLQIDWVVVAHGGMCPKCYKKLYWNRPRTIIRCKSKLHSFVLTAKAYEEIVSGKRLEAYKQHRKKLLK